MSLEFAKVFNFLNSNTIFHRLDPRAKFFIIISFTVLSFIIQNLGGMVMLLFLSLPLVFLAKMGQSFFKGMGGLSFLVFFILIINSYFNSINFALVIILRILTLMLVFSVFFQTTLPEDITQSLISMGISYQTAFSFSLAFRFVPTMARETQIIMDAQRSRGHQIQEGGMIQQIKNLFPLLVPLIMNSIRRAIYVAEALETRAFGTAKKPQFYHPLKFTNRDLLVILLSLALMGIGLWSIIVPQQFPAFLGWNLTI